MPNLLVVRTWSKSAGLAGARVGFVAGDPDVVGNLFIRKGSNANFYVVRFGGDGTGQSWGRYRFVNNTVVSGSSSVFRLFDGIGSLEAHNNVFYRSGGAVSLVRTAESFTSACFHHSRSKVRISRSRGLSSTMARSSQTAGRDPNPGAPCDGGLARAVKRW